MVSSKLFWLLMLAIGGTTYVICRKVLAAIDNASARSLIDALKKNPQKAKEVAEGLDIPYGKSENFSIRDFDRLKAVVQTATSIDDFRILYQAEVDASQYLLIADISYVDFDSDITGNPTDVTKKAYHSFVLRFDERGETLSVWSSLYDTTTTKFQKEAFSRGMTRVAIEMN